MAKCDGLENRRGESPAQVRILYPPQRTKSKIFTLLERQFAKQIIRFAVQNRRFLRCLDVKL